MAMNPHSVEADLKTALAAIRPQLPDQDVKDIEHFIGAGEYGVAADTIFCAIKEDGLAVDRATAHDLSKIASLFNGSGDLDPRIPDEALRALKPLATARR